MRVCFGSVRNVVSSRCCSLLLPIELVLCVLGVCLCIIKGCTSVCSRVPSCTVYGTFAREKGSSWPVCVCVCVWVVVCVCVLHMNSLRGGQKKSFSVFAQHNVNAILVSRSVFTFFQFPSRVFYKFICFKLMRLFSFTVQQVIVTTTTTTAIRKKASAKKAKSD